jgi:hypothetical protein
VLNVSEYQNSHEARVWKELLASLAIVPFLRVQHVVALTKDENLTFHDRRCVLIRSVNENPQRPIAHFNHHKISSDSPVGPRTNLDFDDR